MQVRSFTQEAYLQMLSSSIFYPSNKELRAVQAEGSIKASLGTHSELFNTVDLQSNWHYYTKPVRAVARMVLGIAIVTIAAPVGTLFHFGATIFYGVMWLRSEEDQAAHNWKKVKAHAGYFFVDLLITGIAFWGFASIKWFKELVAAKAGELAITGILASGFLLFCCAVAPHKAIPYLFLEREERAAAYKAIRLKNEFGIVAQGTNGLLPYDPEIDEENLNGSGSLHDLWRCQGMDFLKILKKLNRDYLTGSRRLGGLLLGIDLQHALESINRSIDGEIAEISESAKKKELKDLQKECNALGKNMIQMHRLLKECIEIMEQDITSFLAPSVALPEFPFKYQFSEYFYRTSASDAEFESSGMDRNASNSELWKEFVLKEAIPDTIPSPDSVDETFKALHKALLDQPSLEAFEQSLADIFGLKKDLSAREQRKLWLKAMLKLHPDKHKPENKAVAGVLFNCFKRACELLGINQ